MQVLSTMEAIHGPSMMTEVKITATHGFTPTKQSSDILLDQEPLDSTDNTVSKKKRNAGERMQRSRERNRIHARKTRQRKKEQLQSLQSKAEQLKAEHINLKLAINEKNTANILCCLFSNNQGSQSSSGDDPKVETLLTRPEEEIPDPSKLPALQPLILPSGAQHSKRGNNNVQPPEELPNDGIDYELLGKDRSKCTPAELDQIRRERNRMHAKRTRDRKRLFMEEMAEMCKVLEGENMILQKHLDELNGVKSKSTSQPTTTNQAQTTNSSVAMVSPSLSPTISPVGLLPENHHQDPSLHRKSLSHGEPILPLTSRNGESFDQMKTLLDAAGIFDLDSSAHTETKNTSTSSACVVSVSSEDHMDHTLRPLKKRRQFQAFSNNSSDDDGSE